MKKEYEAYMKKVTDAFIDMHSDQKSTGALGHGGETKVFYQVDWNGGLEYSFNLNCSWVMTGITFEDMKEYNSEVALNYLRENSLTFDQWLKRKELHVIA